MLNKLIVLMTALFFTSSLLASQSIMPFSFTEQVSLNLSSSYNTSLHRNSDIDKKTNMDLLLSPSLTLANKMSLSMNLSGTKDLVDQREFLLNDSTISLSGSFYKINNNIFKLKGALYLPTSDSSRNIEKLYSGFKLAPSVSLPTQYKGLKFFYSLSLKTNFHEFEIALDNNSNIQYVFGNVLTINYAFNDSVSVTSANGYYKKYTYQSYETDQYFFKQEVNLKIDHNFEVFVGHVKGGNPLSSTGQEIAIKLLDSRTSILYLGVDISL